MKKRSFFSLLFFMYLTTNCQNLIINDTIYKAGFYKTFEEFKYNNPSIDLDYNVIAENRPYGVSNQDGLVTLYKLLITKKDGKSIGKVFGFCDGNNIYVNDNLPKLDPDTEFSKIEYIGAYCYYRNVKVRKVDKQTTRAERNMTNTKNIRISNNVGRMMQASTTVTEDRLIEKIINMDSGEVQSLSTKVLRKIIANDTALLDEFNTKSHNSKLLKQYFIRYIENEEL